MTDKKRSMFISYSHFDRKQCDRIANAIEVTNKFIIWYDKGLKPGEVYRKEIAERLKETEVFILLISNASVKSEWIMDEVEFAKSNHCRIIPVWLEPVVMPAELEMIVLRHHGLFWYKYQDDKAFTSDLLCFVGEDMEHSDEWQENKEEFSTEWWDTNSQEIREALDKEAAEEYAYCYEADHALTLARWYYYGSDETKIDPKKALFYFKISAYNGNQDAAFQLLQIELEQLEQEKQTEENYRAYIHKAEEMYKEGSVPAGLFLGNAYYYGRYGCPEYAAKSAAIYEDCARKGNARAQYLMAWYYYHGIGVKQDYDLSVMYAQLAVQQKYMKAYRRMGIFYRDGLALPQDYKKAIDFFEEGKKAGDYYCFCLHGQMYAEGLGVRRNNKKALELFKLGENAPIKGNRYSVYKSKQALGYFYELKGPKMFSEAAKKYMEGYQLGNFACKQDYLRVTAETYQPEQTDGHYSFLD